MRITTWVGLAAAAALQCSPLPAAAQGYGDVIRCESRDYRQVYCDVDARRGARIVRQLSDSECIEGRTWGWDRRGVWVSGGCRGEFEVVGGGHFAGGSSGAYAEVIRCESRDYRQVYCDADTRAGVRIVDQLSDSPCVEGDTWGADRRGVWVRNGCRADFEVGGGYAHGGRGLPIDRGRGHGPARSVICESRDQRYRHCQVPVYREVELVRQLSDNRCDYNRSWGYDANGIWVDRGCRGEFVVY